MAWTYNTGMVDSLIRDYLLQRGFNATLKSFDLDLKQDKEKGFRAEKILQHILNFVYSFDLDSLRAYWNHLESKIFCRFDQTQMLTVKKLEYNLYRLYIVNCMQTGKKKECMEFFEKFSQALGGVSEWKDWFALPFTPHPESNKHYTSYFTKQWSDTFLVSFQNFLAVTFSCMPTPQLHEVMAQDKARIEQLQNEIELLKKKNIESASTATKPTQKTPPNYVKSMGIPGGLVESSPMVVSQPQKKKSLPFSFPTKKSATATNSKSKAPPNKQPTQGSSVSPKPIKKLTEVIQPEPPVAMPTPIQDNIATRNKKLSGYQMERRELLGGTAAAPKAKSIPIKEDNSSNSPVGQATPASSVPSMSGSPKTTTTTPVHQSNATNTAPIKVDITQELTNPVLPSPASPSSAPYLLLSKDEYHEHHSAIVQCRFNNTGGTVASCDKDGVVKVWRYEPALTTVATAMSKSPFLSLEWCKTSETLLLLGTSSGVLRLYETATKQIQQDIITSNNYPRITQIACNSSGSAFATSCVSRTLGSGWSSPDLDSTPLPGRLELWTLSGSRAEIDRILHESPDSDIKCVSFNRDGNLLVSGDANGILTMFDTRNCQPVMSKAAHTKSIYTLQFSENDNFVFTLGADGKFLGWDSRSLAEPITFPIHPLAAGPFEVSGYSGYRQVHKPSGGKLFSFEPEGRHILTCDGNSALIYKIDTSVGSLKKELTLVGHRTPVLSVDWVSTSNCGHCLTGSMDGRVHVTTLLNQ